MTDSLAAGVPDALPTPGIIRERLGKAKREAIDVAMGKGDSWATKVINGESGVRLDDLPRLLDALDLKAVPKHKVCVDPELAHAYEAIVRRATADHSLLFEGDAE